MAGIAAYFGPDPRQLDSLAQGLAPRGDFAATWRRDQLGLAVRGAIPVVYTGAYGTGVVVDGVTEPTTLLARYTEHGPAALLPTGNSTEAYALVLADAVQGTLVLARSGDGPPLHYAVVDGAVLIGSEPGTLLAAGVPAEPDPITVDRFLGTGACDDTERTFFAEIRRVLPGSVLEITEAGLRQVPVPAARSGGVPAPLALGWAARQGRVGVRFGQGIAGAALLGVAFVRPDRPNPLPVYSATFPPLDTGEDEYVGRLLGAMPEGAVAAKAVPVGAADVVRGLAHFLIDLGEPVPHPAGFVMWATAREAAGEVDILLDPAGVDGLLGGVTEPPPRGGARVPAQLDRPAEQPAAILAPGTIARLADRVTSRFGVSLRLPYRDVGDTGTKLLRELAELVRRSLPPEAARNAEGVRRCTPTRELLLGLADRVVATFLSDRFARRPWADPRAALAGFADLVAGRRQDAETFWRLYILEHWLRVVVEPQQAGGTREPVGAGSGRGVTVDVDGSRWLRLPVFTPAPVEADLLTDAIGWHVAEIARTAAADRRCQFEQPWYLVVAAEAVAVAQGRAYPSVSRRPGWWARRLSRYDRSATGVQRAIDRYGVLRLLVAAVTGRLTRLVQRLDVGSGPATVTATLAGVGHSGFTDGWPTGRVYNPISASASTGPEDADRVAADLFATVLSMLPPAAAATLHGCAVVATGPEGTTVYGRTGDRTDEFYAVIGADDALGYPPDRAPVAIVIRADAGAEGGGTDGGLEPVRSVDGPAGAEAVEPAVGSRAPVAGDIPARRQAGSRAPQLPVHRTLALLRR